VSTYLSDPLPVARPTIVWVKLPDGAVLFDPETEVYYGMNVVAASVWELLPEAAGDVEKLCSLVQERFRDAELEQIRTDVLALLDDLEHAGLVGSNGAKPEA
jgi:Coenzyme PQQ synthesis protein D (PqqD)